MFKIAGENQFLIDPEKIKQGLCNLDVKIEKKRIFFFKEVNYVVGIMLKPGRIAVGRKYRPPMVSLPWCVVGYPDICNFLPGPAAMLYRNNQRHRPVGCHDHAAVSKGLLDEMFVFLNRYLPCMQDSTKIIYGAEKSCR